MYTFPKEYDVIVVGAGHAGIEAALAAARMGRETLLLTINLDTIGQMSCNPAIGGLAKGHLVREIDALGGEMGRATDQTGIQFRMLNMRKGPAVRAPRAQCDKKAYQFYMKWVCERTPKLDVKQGLISRLIVQSGKVTGIETDFDVKFQGRVVVITTGTFLRGLIHVGTKNRPGGRMGDIPATTLSQSFMDNGIVMSRLKTGTPPRLVKKSIDFSKMGIQPGDTPIPFFSYSTPSTFHVEQVPCWLTHTTERTAQIIRENLHLSPLYAGIIEGIGPRYCPSIEDKVVRFCDKETHQIYLEPEGRVTDEFYVNGCSTSLPFPVQVELIHSIVGLENADIIRPAYAIEYDYADPIQLHPWLETKAVQNLFFAGQINGTSGYEEAAAQGLYAGINAASRSRDEAPFLLDRSQAYLGVLVDDLVTKGTKEPYRMFTSRAEYRLVLRQDNADLRLTDLAHKLGLVKEEAFSRLMKKMEIIQAIKSKLGLPSGEGVSMHQFIRRPEASVERFRDKLVEAEWEPDIAREAMEQVDINAKYEGYIQREVDNIRKFKELESKIIPEWLNYQDIKALRTESRLKLKEIQPKTIGQASRIMGVSSADISILLVWIKRGKGHSSQQQASGEAANALGS